MTGLPRQLQPANAIHDPVHGQVWLTKVEIDLINSEQFQRLRGIGQLTPVDLVFPGATHKRFAHSIGAAHVIGMIAAHKRVAAYFEDGRDELVQLLRLAALLHDVGHLPFSHVGEMAWLAAGPYRAASETGEEVSIFDFAAAAGVSRSVHEELSALLVCDSPIAKIIDAACAPVDGEAASVVVQRIIDGSHPDLVMRNLLSSDLDCDRLDYLLRDSLTAGLVYGHIDLGYLVGSLLVADGPDGPTLAIDGRHGLLTGEHFLLARYFHYAQFVTHKTVAAAEVTLIAAILELIRTEGLPQPEELIDSSVDSSERIETLMRLTDAHVEAKIQAAARGESESQLLVDISRRLVQRKLPKVAGRRDALQPARAPGTPLVDSWDQRLGSPAHRRQVAQELGIDPVVFCYRRTSIPLSGVEGDISPTSALADPAGLEARVRKAAKVSFGDGAPELLIDHSPILKGLSKNRWTTRRVFALEPLDSYEPRQPTADFEALRLYLDADEEQ